MKKRMKTITTIVLLAFVLSVLSPCTVFAAESPQDAAIDAALEYMNARKEMLATGDTDALSARATQGVVADEVKHREYLVKNNITLPMVIYKVDSVELLDGGYIVSLREISAFSFAGSSSVEVLHTLLITIGQNDLLLVVSDQYLETHTGFASCSYVPPEAIEQSRAHLISNNSCFLYITYKEVGYLEKATNSQLDSHTANAGSGKYTKYGEWIGVNPGEWCAPFVSWCANQAQISTSYIPRTGWTPTMLEFYVDRGRYYSRLDANEDAHVPQPGDVVFLDWGEPFSHMGMVYAVNGDYITFIHGNWGDAVVMDTKNKTDTFFVGYGVTNIPEVGHHWVGVPMTEYCSICGINRGYTA